MRRRVWAWLAVAAAMYLSRRRDLRRGALRGLLAAGIARAFALSVPALRDAADDATAAGFVTAAGLEATATAAPLVPLALVLNKGDRGAVGVRTAAIGAGAAAALASTRAWPVPPALGPTAPKVMLREHAECTADGEGLTIVINADSGPSNAEPPTEALRSALPNAEVVEVDVERGDEIRKALDAAISNGALAVGVSGGDGTINTAAQVALDARKPLVVVPGGTFNHLTQAVGIESVEDAVQAVKAGEAVGVDVATVGGRAFLNTASFGSYVELVDAREKLEESIGKWPALVVALIRVLRHSEPIDVEIDGEPKRVWMAFIGNCSYHPSGFAPTWRERLDDGLLDFRYVTGDQPYARTRLVLAVLTGRLGRSNVYRQARVERFTLRSLDGPLRMARDGETFEAAEEVVVEKLGRRLTVYAPHAKNP